MKCNTPAIFSGIAIVMATKPPFSAEGLEDAAASHATNIFRFLNSVLRESGNPAGFVLGNDAFYI